MSGQMESLTPTEPAAHTRVAVENLGGGLVTALGEAVGSAVQIGHTGSAALTSIRPNNLDTTLLKGKTAGLSKKASELKKSADDPKEKNCSNLEKSAAGLQEKSRKLTPPPLPIARAANGVRLVASGAGRMLLGSINIIFGISGCLTGTVVCIGKTISHAVREAREESPTGK